MKINLPKPDGLWDLIKIYDDDDENSFFCKVKGLELMNADINNNSDDDERDQLG